MSTRGRPTLGAWAAAATLAVLASAELGCGGDSGQLEVRWTIGGVQPPSSRSDPWTGLEASLDSCAEVDAAQIDLRTLAGPSNIEQRLPCSTSVVASDGGTVKLQHHTFGAMGLGDYELAAFLIDSTGDRLTRELTTKTTVTVRQGVARFNFDYANFRDGSDRPIVKNGNYRFSTSYGGKSCADVGPPAPQTQLVRLLDAAGKVVRAQVCAGRQCADTTGSSSLPCVPSDQTQLISEVPWGSYRLELSAQSARGMQCWAVAQKITIGAGENPTSTHDLAALSACP